MNNYTTETLPTWVAAGENAAIYNSGRGRAEDATATIVTIAKVGKLHIETTDGAKFRVRNLASTVRPSSYSTADELRAVDDADVLDALRRRQASKTKMELFRLITSNTVLRGNDPANLLADVTAIREAAERAEVELRKLVEQAAKSAQS